MTPGQVKRADELLAASVLVMRAKAIDARSVELNELADKFDGLAQEFRQERFRLNRTAVENLQQHNAFPNGRWG